MSVRYRLTEPRDVPACAAIIARHPFLGARYGEAVHYLAPAWQNLLRSEECVSAVFEEKQGGRTVTLGGAIATFVTREFADQLKSPPHFWIGPEIVRRIHAGRSPVLTHKQVRDANSTDGLITAIFHSGVLPEHQVHADVANTVHGAFTELHLGYRIREILVQGECTEHIQAARAIGIFLWNPVRSSYERMDRVQPEDLLDRPHLLGVTRELTPAMHGLWGAAAFLHHAPRFGFSRSQQRLLSSGLLGGTDNEIAEELAISLDAVKKTWRDIYDRVATVDPGLLPNSASKHSGSAERGKAKKQLLLAYVNNHPEELRPVSRRLLRTSQAEQSAEPRRRVNGSIVSASPR
jgi:DNA-binding CsgD family transcriptional regulator